MSLIFLTFILVLVIVAILLGESASFVLTLLYILVGTHLLTRFWSLKSLQSVFVNREYVPRMFFGEQKNVRVTLRNSSFLPIVWLQVRESLPSNIVLSGIRNQVVTIPPKGSYEFEYQVRGRKRGYYPIGPLDLFTGDVMGISPIRSRRVDPDNLIVYPKIIPLTTISIPSFIPVGFRRYEQPIFEDPTKVFGKREYQSGDSIRRMDWKGSAANDSLLVKMLEPSVDLDTMLFLNLNVNDFGLKGRYEASELAIVITASILNWISERRQTFGYLTNGFDPLFPDVDLTFFLPRSGRTYLLQLLESLARIQVKEGTTVSDMIYQGYHRLSWGTSMILITPDVNKDSFDALFSARRSGLNISLVIVGREANYQEINQIASTFTMPTVRVTKEEDLEIWQR